MSNPHTQESAPVVSSGQAQRQPSWWRGRPWYVAAVTLLSLAILVLGLFLIERRVFPRYWSAEDLGPIATNAAQPPRPTPEGMVWIPGGVFWMGSADFPDAQAIHKAYV